MRSQHKDQSFWFESQNEELKGIKEKILAAGNFFNWQIDLLNKSKRPLLMDDLQGLQRLPFDPSQTIFCDKTKPGCKPRSSPECKNKKLRFCHKMPIWENEAPFDQRQYDINQNDDDFYHEQEDYPIVFWEDLTTEKESKYFFHEQLKILANYIQNADPKILIDKETLIGPHMERIRVWNEEYDHKFLKKTTKIESCEAIRIDNESALKSKAKCNQWSAWKIIKKCPICGSGKYTEVRECSNFDKTMTLSTKLCESQNQKSRRELVCTGLKICPQIKKGHEESICKLKYRGKTLRGSLKNFKKWRKGERWQKGERDSKQVPKFATIFEQSAWMKNCHTGCWTSRSRPYLICEHHVEWNNFPKSKFPHLVQEFKFKCANETSEAKKCSKNWGNWLEDGCDKCYYDEYRLCYYQDTNGHNLHRTSGCKGSSTRSEKWSSKCGWGCKHKWDDPIWNG